MSARQSIRTVWHRPLRAERMIVVADTAIFTHQRSVIALDDAGNETWRHAFERAPYRLAVCGLGAVVDLSDRSAPTQIIALDLGGNEKWRYDRRWGLFFDGVAGDARGAVFHGQDNGTTNDRWVGLDAASGAVSFDVPSPASSAALPAGRWLLALVDGGEGGVVRTDRDATNPTTLTTLGVSAWAASEKMLLINTIAEGPGEVVAFDLASGRERWRAPGGNNDSLAILDNRAAWLAGDPVSGRPVVHDIETGAEIWTGEPLPVRQGAAGSSCKLGPDALVCYAGKEQIAVYSLDARAPLAMRPWNRDVPSASRFWDRRFLEARVEGLTCWELA